VSPARAAVTAATRFVSGHGEGLERRRGDGVPIVWFATPFDIAAADSAGLVTTTRPGQTYVFALAGGKPGFAVLDIAERAPVRLEIAAPDGARSGGGREPASFRPRLHGGR
jgi:hypothetical protein